MLSEKIPNVTPAPHPEILIGAKVALYPQEISKLGQSPLLGSDPVFLDVEHKDFAFPRSDYLLKFLALKFFDVAVELHEGLTERALHCLAILESIDRFVEIAMQTKGQIIGTAFDWVIGLQAFHHAQIATCQCACQSQIRIYVGPCQTIFHTSGFRLRIWNPESNGAIVHEDQ